MTVNYVYVLHCDLDSFYASVEQALRPNLKGRPVAISAARGQRVIIASSYEAKRKGIKVGVPLTQAFKIEPELNFLRARMEAYEQVSQRFFELVKAEVGTYQSLGPDECFINAAHISGSFGEEGIERSTNFALYLKSLIKSELGINLTIGGGSNKVIAKLASDKGKPDGLLLLKSEQEENFLYSAKIEDVAGIGSALESKLKNSGIYFMKDAVGIPRESLTRLLGKHHGKWLYNLVNFTYFEDIVPNPTPKSISVMRSLGIKGESARGAFERLLPELGEKLAKEKLATKKLSIFVATPSQVFEGGYDFKAPIGSFPQIVKELRRLFLAVPSDLRASYLGIALTELSPVEQLPLDFGDEEFSDLSLIDFVDFSPPTTETLLMSRAHYNMELEHPTFGKGRLKAIYSNCLEIEFAQGSKLLESWAPLFIAKDSQPRLLMNF